ncbi:MAG: hypothetical protein AAF602_08215 [Myxococcota bacterium]
MKSPVLAAVFVIAASKPCVTKSASPLPITVGYLDASSLDPDAWPAPNHDPPGPPGQPDPSDRIFGTPALHDPGPAQVLRLATDQSVALRSEGFCGPRGLGAVVVLSPGRDAELVFAMGDPDGTDFARVADLRFDDGQIAYRTAMTSAFGPSFGPYPVDEEVLVTVNATPTGPESFDVSVSVASSNPNPSTASFAVDFPEAAVVYHPTSPAPYTLRVSNHASAALEVESVQIRVSGSCAECTSACQAKLPG